MTSQSSVDDALEELSQRTGGRLDILINNVSVPPIALRNEVEPQAAVWGRHTTLDVDMEDLRATYETNLFGPVRMIQACVPLMLSHPAQSSSQTKGKERKPMIVNIGSQAAVGIPWQAGYSSSKVIPPLLLTR